MCSFKGWGERTTKSDQQTRMQSQKARKQNVKIMIPRHRSTHERMMFTGETRKKFFTESMSPRK